MVSYAAGFTDPGVLSPARNESISSVILITSFHILQQKQRISLTFVAWLHYCIFYDTS